VWGGKGPFGTSVPVGLHNIILNYSYTSTQGREVRGETAIHNIIIGGWLLGKWVITVGGVGSVEVVVYHIIRYYSSDVVAYGGD